MKRLVLAVVYNATNNELVRTKTLVKGAIIQIDATPFRRWYENHYAIPLGRKKIVEAQIKKTVNKKRSFKVKGKVAARKAIAPVEQKLEDEFTLGRLLGRFPT